MLVLFIHFSPYISFLSAERKPIYFQNEKTRAIKQMFLLFPLQTSFSVGEDGAE
jgi:hypothetical protein